MLGYIRKKISKKNFFRIPDSTPFKLIFPFNIKEGNYGLGNFNPQIVDNKISTEEVCLILNEIKSRCKDFKYFVDIKKIVDYTNTVLTITIILTMAMILLGLIISLLQHEPGLHIISIIGIVMGFATVVISLIFIFYFQCTFEDNVEKCSSIIKQVLAEKNNVYVPLGIHFMTPNNSIGNEMAWLEMYLEYKLIQSGQIHNNPEQIENQPLQNNLCPGIHVPQIEYQNFNQIIVGQPIYQIHMNNRPFVHHSPANSFDFGENHPVLEKDED